VKKRHIKISFSPERATITDFCDFVAQPLHRKPIIQSSIHPFHFKLINHKDQNNKHKLTEQRKSFLLYGRSTAYISMKYLVLKYFPG